MVPGKAYHSTFLSVSRLLEMAHRNHAGLPEAQAKRVANHGLGLNVGAFSGMVKAIVAVSDQEIEDVLRRLAKMKAVEFTSLRGAESFAEKYVKVVDPESFAQVANALHEEVQKADFSLISELQYVDIRALAEYVQANPETIYKKIANREIPESLFSFPRDRIIVWAEEQEKGFFQPEEQKRKQPGEFEDVDDVVHLDNACVKEALGRLGYHKTAVLLAVAGGKARRKLKANLSGKLGQVIEREAAERHVDEAEAEDVQMELAEVVKQIKGVEG